MNQMHQKSKNTIATQQQSGQAPNSSYNPNQQQVPRNNAPYLSYDGDASKYTPYGTGYLGAAGAGGVPPRLPLVAGIPSTPNPPLAGSPNVAGVMPQGPPPGSFVGHAAAGGIDLSKQTPPHHQGAHHPGQLPPGPMVNQQIAMANPGHAGPAMQGRPNQGSYQGYNNRNPGIRQGNQHMPRPPMNAAAGAAINPSHPPNPQAIPYPNQSLGPMNPIVFVVGAEHQGYNAQQQMFAYSNPSTFYQPGGNMPATQFQPRPAQAGYPYRPTTPYQYPMQSSPAVYYAPQPQQQQQQPQQSQQPPQAQQQQQVQQVPQQQQAVPASPAVAVPQGAMTPTQPQPQRDAGSATRRTRSKAIQIVDPTTHTDVLTGEKVEVSTPPVPETHGVDAPPTPGTPSTNAAPIATITEEPPTTAPVPTTVTAVVEAATTPAETAAPVVEQAKETVKAAEIADSTLDKVEAPATLTVDKKESAPVAVAVPVAAPKPTPLSPAAKENGPVATAPDAVTSSVPTPTEQPPSSSASSAPQAPVPASISPDPVEGRGNAKGSKSSKRRNSRSGSTPTPTSPPPEEASAVAATAGVRTGGPALVAPASTSEARASSQEKEAPAPPVAAALPATAAPSVPSVPAAAEPVPPSKAADQEIKEISSVETVAPKEAMVVQESLPTDKMLVDTVPIEPVIINGDKQVSPSSSVIESVSTPPSAVSDDGEKSSGKALRYVYKDDQWSPVNPEGKKAYDRTFLLELQNNPASQKKPPGLPNLEVVKDKQTATIKRGISIGSDFTPPFLKMVPGKPQGLPKRASQQGSREGMGGGQGQGPPPRREIKFMSSTSIIRQERVEDPNVWKPKHAAKTKDDSPDKAQTEELMKTVRGILNKLTPSKFDKLLQRIQALNIDTEERLAGVIKLFFEKAVDEPIFSTTYAKMCHALSGKEVTSSANAEEKTNFRKLLLNRCQREFEKDSAGLIDVENKKKEIEANQVEEKKKELEEELEDLVSKNRRRSLGNIRFIGELFKLRILSAKIMHQCILRLLSQPEDEESLEALCRLLSTIGKELELAPTAVANRSASNSARETMNSYFSTLDGIVAKKKISNRIRFMIQDVVDLRKSNWKPRREDNNPKTIEQIHKEVHKEREDQERELNNPQNFQGSMGSMSGQMGRDNRMGDRRGDRIDDRNRKQSRPNDDGWNTVNNNRGNTRVDMKQLRIPKLGSSNDTTEASISLGPGGRGMGSWGRGASGGMASQSMTGGSSGSGSGMAPNRYQILEDDSGQSSHDSGKAPFSGRSSLGGPSQTSAGRGNQDYRTMPGATKSAFFPPKDGDRERNFDSIRSQNPGPAGRSRSQQSSRENSVSRPARDTPQQPPALSREPSKDLLLGKPNPSEDEIKRKAHSVLGEFFINESIENAALDIKEWCHSTSVARFINECLMFVLERNKEDRRATGTLFKEMAKRKYFAPKDIVDGFEELMASSEDFLVDIPKLWEYVAQLVEPLLEDHAVPVTLLRHMSSSLTPALACDFIAATLKELVSAQKGGAVDATRIWMTADISLAALLPDGVDAVSFVAKHKELEFTLKNETNPKNAAVGGKKYLEFQRDLEKYLRSGNLTTEEVCTWIQKQNLGEVNSAFIRALVTAVTESAIEGCGTDSKLNGNLLKNYEAVLRRYVDNVAERELQLLFAVQALIHQRQHPKGLIQGIFESLYDSNVVSEEGFESWVSIDEPSERDGKAVAIKSLTSFLTWLKEAEAEDSDQDGDG